MPKARRRSSRNRPKKKPPPISTAHFIGNRQAQAFKDEQLQRITKLIDKEADSNGKLPHGCIRRHYQQEKLTLDWLTIHQLYGVRRRRTEKEALEKEEREERELEAEEAGLSTDYSSMNDDDDDATVNPLIRQAIGRNKGSTIKAKEEFAKLKEKLNEDIAVWWDKITKDENDGTQLFEVISTQKTLARLDVDVDVKETTIISRVKRGNFINVKTGVRSPMERLEPTLCCMLKFGSRMGQYVSQRSCIDIANELIKGKKIGRRVAEWMLKHNPATRRKLLYNPHYYPPEEVGWGWFVGFRNRYKEITSKYISNVKHYRVTWSTYAMLLDMYKMVYGLFLEWQHAIELPESQWQDQHGNEVPEDEAIGCKVEYKLLYPDRVLTMDETGDNGNQSGDKINRGDKFICETGKRRDDENFSLARRHPIAFVDANR